MQDAGSAMLTSLRDQIAALNGDQAALMQYKAALLGVSEQAGPLIAQLEAAKQAVRDKAQADADAARNARQLAAEERQNTAARERFVQGLRDELASAEAGSAGLVRYRAAQLGVSEEAAPLIARLEQAKAATKAKADADADAARKARELASADQQAQATRDRFVRALQDQVATQGKTTSQLLEYRAAQLGVSAEAAPLIAQLRAAEGQMGKTGVSAGQMRAAMAQLPMQMQDVIVSLQGGQAPLTVLLQQGSQVAGSFGGVGNAFAAVGRYALGLINPVTLAAGAVAALTAISVAGSVEQAHFRDSLLLTGNFAGMTRDRFDQLAGDVQKASGVTSSAARDIAAAAVASGAFGVQSIGTVAQAMGKMQKLSGASTDAVVKDFAAMRNGVANWAADHNRQYNFLTAAQFNYIATLERQGKTQEAMAETARLLDAAMAERLDQRKGQLGALERAWDGVKSAASGAWQAMLNIGREDTLGQKLDKAQARLDELRRKAVERYGGVDKVPERAAALREGLQTTQAQIDSLQEQIRLENQATTAAAARAKAEQDKIDAINNGSADRQATAALALELQQQQNASAARIALLEQEKARVEGLHRMQVTDESSYAAQKLAIDEKILTERAKLVDAEIAIEERRPVKSGDVAAADQQQAKILALQAQKAQIESQKVIAGINTQFDPPKLSEWQQAVSGMGEQVAKLKFQADGFEQFGDKVTSAAEAAMRFETESGKFKTLTDAQKTALIDAAKAVDDYTAALDRAKAGFAFDRGTKEIERQTAELGQNALQRKINADLQELENAGIKKGTDLYERLAAERRAALVASEAASKSWATGVSQGIDEIQRTISDNAAMAKGLLTDVFRGAEDALVSFITTGKADFKSFVNSVIADLARIQIRRMLADLTSSGGSDWLKTGLSAAVALFAGSSSGYTGAGNTGTGFANAGAGDYSSASMSNIFAPRAGGGRVEPYTTYRINENGPETLKLGPQSSYVLKDQQSRAVPAVAPDRGVRQAGATYQVDKRTGIETLTMGREGGYILNAKQTRAQDTKDSTGAAATYFAGNGSGPWVSNASAGLLQAPQAPSAASQVGYPFEAKPTRLEGVNAGPSVASAYYRQEPAGASVAEAKQPSAAMAYLAVDSNTGAAPAKARAGDSSTASKISSMTPRAGGGRAQPFATYKVNENGPETLTMGSQGGFILNAKQTRAAQDDKTTAGKSPVVHFTQTNNIGSNVSRSEVAAALVQAKEAGKAEILDTLRRHGAMG